MSWFPLFSVIIFIQLLYVTGMVKSQRLPANIITPTTKAADHDVPVTPDEVYVYHFTLHVLLFQSFIS